MENRFSQLRAPGLIAAFAALMLALCALVCPDQATAAERIAHSVDASGKVTNYYTVSEVEQKGPNADVVVMDADWHLDSAFTVGTNTKLTIDMNGHKVDCRYTCFWVQGKAELVLKSSSDPVTFAYMGYNPQTGDDSYVKSTTGGLVNTLSKEAGGAFSVGKNGKLTLDNVTAGGSYGSDEAGGVNLSEKSSLTLQNGAKVEYNRGAAGGGVYCSDTDATINIDNACIANNYCTNYGGGIYAKYANVTINMKNGAKIANNSAKAGGGIYFNDSNFSVSSSDSNAFVSGNTARESSQTTTKSKQSGGGIHVNSTSGNNKGLIEGITISENYSAYDGGGLELDQQYTTLKNCKITGNWCKYEGGGIYVCNDGNTIDGCTITDNACSVDSGGNYEGGGVFVWHSYDIELKGVCDIRYNTRGKNSGDADDVMLRENAGATAKAYITGSLAKGSTVGVRTGTTGDRRIAKNFKPETKDCLFYDMEGYYVSYGGDEGGDAWQRHTTIAFAFKVNGETKARYKWKDSVGQVVPASLDGDRVFWYWADDGTTGLNPIWAYINDDVRYMNVLVMAMPQNDVDAHAVYATRVKQLAMDVDAPVAGQELPKTAKVQRADKGVGGSSEMTMPVTWYEVDDETKARTQASGLAKADTTYVASVTCAESYPAGLHFSWSISEEDVTVKTGSDESAAASAKLDGKTGALTVETKSFTTEGKKTEPEKADGKVTVKTVKGNLKDAASGKAQTVSDEGGSSDGIMLLSLDDENLDSGNSQDGFEVSYAADSKSVTVTAPALEGYNFCNWDGVPDGVDYKDTDGYVTIPVSSLRDDTVLTAEYTPAVTDAAITMDMEEAAPTAGQELATSASSLVLTGTDGSKLDFIEDVVKKDCPVTWSPAAAGEDGEAGYSTAYTALIDLGKADGLEDVDKVLDRRAAVTCNGAKVEAAGFTVSDGELYFAVSFPATAIAEATGITQPADMELTFEQAKACSELGIWPLAKAVDVTVQSGVAAEGDITWQPVEGFDANATGAQELAAHGTVTKIVTADGSEIDASGISHEVACKIKVAAPAQGGDEGNGQPAAGDGANKSALAKTSDSIPVLAVAAVVAIAIAAIAVSIVAARRRRQ